MFLQSLLPLLAAATCASALALPPTNLQERDTTVPPPLSPPEAQQLFNGGGPHHFSPAVVLPTGIRPSPPKASVTAVVAPPLVKGTPLPPNLPGIPAQAHIQVLANQSVPLTSVLHGNATSVERRASDPYCVPDPRYLIETTAYPYNTVGRVGFSGGSCTGTLVGPRHVLTASHCIGWTNGGASWDGVFQFLPDYWPGGPYKPFTASRVYNYYASTKGDPTTLTGIALDMVVVILDEYTNMGWMGTQTYSTAWNNGHYWSEVGYAGNPGNSVYPYYQGPFTVTNEYGESFGDMLRYAACTTPGDSGSPVWAYWADGPHIVGLMTETGDVFGNGTPAGWGPGGQALVNLVAGARSAWP